MIRCDAILVGKDEAGAFLIEVTRLDENTTSTHRIHAKDESAAAMKAISDVLSEIENKRS